MSIKKTYLEISIVGVYETIVAGGGVMESRATPSRNTLLEEPRGSSLTPLVPCSFLLAGLSSDSCILPSLMVACGGVLSTQVG